jgi:hypothetical protein
MGGRSMKHSEITRLHHRLDNIHFAVILVLFLVAAAFNYGIGTAGGWTFAIWFFGQWWLNHHHNKEMTRLLEREDEEQA